MRFEAFGANWTGKLADAIESASPGDSIVVQDVYAQEMGQRAAERMSRSGLAFVLRGETSPYEEV